MSILDSIEHARGRLVGYYDAHRNGGYDPARHAALAAELQALTSCAQILVLADLNANVRAGTVNLTETDLGELIVAAFAAADDAHGEAP